MDASRDLERPPLRLLENCRSPEHAIPCQDIIQHAGEAFARDTGPQISGPDLIESGQHLSIDQTPFRATIDGLIDALASGFLKWYRIRQSIISTVRGSFPMLDLEPENLWRDFSAFIGSAIDSATEIDHQITHQILARLLRNQRPHITHELIDELATATGRTHRIPTPRHSATTTSLQRSGSHQRSDRPRKKPRLEATTHKTALGNLADSSTAPDERSSFQWADRYITFEYAKEQRLALFQWNTRLGIVWAGYFCHSIRCGQPYLRSPLSTTPDLCCDHTDSCGIQKPRAKVDRQRIYSNFWFVIPSDYHTLSTKEATIHWLSGIQEHMRAMEESIEEEGKEEDEEEEEGFYVRPAPWAYFNPVLKDAIRRNFIPEVVGAGQCEEMDVNLQTTSGCSIADMTTQVNCENVQAESLVLRANQPFIFTEPRSTPRPSTFTKPASTPSASTPSISTLSTGSATPFAITPWTSDLLSEREHLEKRKIIDAFKAEAHLFGIEKCTFRGVENFFDKYFNPKDWSSEQKTKLEKILSAHNRKQWTGHPSTSSNDLVWGLVVSLAMLIQVDAPHRLTTWTRDYTKSFFFQSRVTTRKIPSKFYRHLLAVGFQTRYNDPDQLKTSLFRLALYARRAFKYEPTRRFMHAFSLCGSTMELWVFDRCGVYSSGPFDIHEEPGKFACAIVGYLTVGDDDMGLSTFIVREAENCYITLNTEGGDEELRVGFSKLGSRLFRQQNLVGHGPTQYATNEGVLRFSWDLDEPVSEAAQLRLAEDRGVEGVVKLVAHRRITTIAEMREGLVFTGPHQFQDDTNQVESLRPSAKPWRNRVYSCLVYSPMGYPISRANTASQLLESLRDAIKAHRSLYITGNILHCGISLDSIIIPKRRTKHGLNGMLSGLNFARARDGGQNESLDPIGTVPFMAVEVLRKVSHTYRHDLESFFYVLLWVCVRNSGKKIGVPQKSALRRWEVGTFDTIADKKAGDMSTAFRLRYIMAEFPADLNVLKPLCFRIRELLFPFNINDGAVFLGTPLGDPDQLYGPIIAAFEETIRKL